MIAVCPDCVGVRRCYACLTTRPAERRAQLTERNAMNLITADDVGRLVTVKVKPARGQGKWFYVSGTVRAVSPQNVTIGVMRHPTGPWDKWESHEVPATIEHRRIMRRA